MVQASGGDVVEICQQLLRFDTSNPGGTEAAAAEYVADLLSEVGLPVTRLAAKPGRDNLAVRIPGRDASRPALLVHCHLDVVPVDERSWSVDPFGGMIRDGCLWGRGAVDMKDMAAMMLVAARAYRRTGTAPARDVVMLFLADEEMGGELGAHHVIQQRPDLLAGCTEAIGEVGGFSLEATPDRRIYLVATAEKGVAWLRLRASGAGGHASMVHDDNPVAAIAAAVHRLSSGGRHQVSGAPERFLRELAAASNLQVDLTDPRATGEMLRRYGPVSRMLAAVTRHTYNATMISGGFKENVVPPAAEALVDARFLPGLYEDLLGEVASLLDGHDVEWTVERFLPAVETTVSQSFLDTIERALRVSDPEARVIPYALSAGSDAKAFSPLGMSCYGFTPLRLPADFDFSAQFHGSDERVPIESLRFGADVLKQLLDNC